MITTSSKDRQRRQMASASPPYTSVVTPSSANASSSGLARTMLSTPVARCARASLFSIQRATRTGSLWGRAGSYADPVRAVKTMRVDRSAELSVQYRRADASAPRVTIGDGPGCGVGGSPANDARIIRLQPHHKQAGWLRLEPRRSRRHANRSTRSCRRGHPARSRRVACGLKALDCHRGLVAGLAGVRVCR